jgi:hypothetical protein
MLRKMYDVKIQISEMPGTEISALDHAVGDKPGVMNIGIEGEDIVEAIYALGGALPKGTVFEVLSAKLEGTFETADQVRDGTHIQELPEGERMDLGEVDDENTEDGLTAL